MSAARQIRVAGVGAGYFSQFHYDSWRRMDQVELVGACDTDLKRAESSATTAYCDLDQMLRDQNPDLLDVIVPPVAQAEVLRRALKSGIKWIICQKPFCTDMDEAKQVLAQTNDADTTIIIHENFRFQPWYRAIADCLKSGDIGTVLNATFRLRPGDGQGQDAYLDRQPYFQTMPRFMVHETAVHWIDTFRFLFGTPTAVYADLRRINDHIVGEDAGHILFDFPNHVRAVFDGNRHLDHAADNLRRTMGEALIEGTKGALSLHGDGSVTLRKFGGLAETALIGPDSWNGFGGDCVHALQSHVVSGLLNGAPLENEASDYLKVMAIEHAIYASAETGCKQDLRHL